MKLITSHETGKTPSAITVGLAAVISAYFLFIWFYFGEFNWSKRNWLLSATQGQSAVINTNLLLLLLIPLIVPILVALIIRFVIKKWVGIDIIPILVSWEIMFNAIILTGLMPHLNSTWILTARVIIVLVVLIVTFTLLNKLINSLIMRSRFGVIFFSQKYNELEMKKNQNAEIHNIWKMGRKNKKEYLEVNEEDDVNKTEGLK